MAVHVSTLLVAAILVTFSSLTKGSKIDCTFSSDFCSYQHDLNAQFNWTLNTGETPSPNTGPLYGSYAYIETSWPRLNTETASLISAAVLQSDGNCFGFFYHMRGMNVRTLNVYAQEASGTRTLLWTMTGAQGDKWLVANVPLPVSAGNAIKVVFEGLSGTGYMGDIAIGNVRLVTKASCSVVPLAATPTTPRPKPVPVAPVVSNCGVRPPKSRIVGGTAVAHGDWPWQAMLMYKNAAGGWKQFCGGTLVDSEWVVTASHCINDIAPSDYVGHKIRLGAFYTDTTKLKGSETDHNIRKIYMHEDYNKYPYEYDNDIALIRLATPAIRSKYIHPACLPTGTAAAYPAGTVCSITGWGRLSSGGNSPAVMYQAQTNLVSYATCTKSGSYKPEVMTSRMQCAQKKGVDTCQGDSGGPLVCESNGVWSLVGVTSWGYGCAHPDYPGIYAKVTELKDWIFHIMNNP